jgi:hypothetical protein
MVSIFTINALRLFGFEYKLAASMFFIVRKLFTSRLPSRQVCRSAKYELASNTFLDRRLRLLLCENFSSASSGQ